ncbi:nucleotide kinase [Salicola phage CGphi29]|uniref:nucleotide kinase n=1 Tax=Salicola phage CGphi29 TaxID=754067 RepID=UPI0002C06C32|nr:nucleotide kinase [Salicola phage CGphi29]AGH31854.1 hypothetical protein SLPG_00060 [Salicola phage CGphi29]
MSNEPVWTPWITNPGDGACPVPEWTEDFELWMIPSPPGRIDKPDFEADQYDWGVVIGATITHYRYALPADLAWLAENVSEWNPDAMHQDESGISFLHCVRGEASHAHPNSYITDVYPERAYTKAQWLRARRDLGYEKPQIGVDMADGNGDWTGYQEVSGDPVNSPQHYQSTNGIECIEAIQAALGNEAFVSYCRGNALKYIWRCGDKGKPKEDLQKAAWYMNKAAEVIGND